MRAFSGQCALVYSVMIIAGLSTSACTGSLFLFESDGAPGSPCLSNGDCQSGECSNEVCTEIPQNLPGQPCTSDIECRDFCDEFFNLCVEEEPLAGLPVGQACAVDADCRSGDCGTFVGERYCTEPCVGGLCPNLPGVGLACFGGKCVIDTFCEDSSGVGLGPGCQAGAAVCSTCADEATCVQVGFEYECICNAGLAGDGTVCEIDLCSSDPCENGGRCDQNMGTISCSCPRGFEGEFCETNIDDCVGDPCQNGGTCVDRIDFFECQCPPNFVGTTCQIEIDPCEGIDCQNGGICEQQVSGNFGCTCATGFMGARCTLSVDDCPTPNPCANGGVCVDGDNTFTCNCQNGYAGATCETDLDLCASVTCQNGGTCEETPSGNSAFCNCLPGFTGSLCEDTITCDEDVDCQPDQFCDTTQMPNRCSTDVCTANARRCEGNQVMRCLPNGSGEEILVDCDNSRAEFASVCVESSGDAGCTCEDDWDCANSFQVCSVDICTGSTTAPSCTLPPADFQDALPTIEDEWGGQENNRNAVDSPFPAYAQVVQTPIVANLDDDNADGLIDERDFPEIIFGAFSGSSYQDDGVLRAIHGGGPNRGDDYFAVCGTGTWKEGDALDALPCTNAIADINPTSGFAVGDLNYDGVPEVIVVTDGGGIRIHDNTGDVITTSADAGLGAYKNAALTIANLDNAGLVEVVAGPVVFTLHEPAGDIEVADIFRIGDVCGSGGTSSCPDGVNGQGPVSCIGDLIGDSRQEIVAGSGVYELPEPPAGATRPGDCPVPCTTCTATEQAFCDSQLVLAVTYAPASHITEGFCAIANVWGDGASAAEPPSREFPLDADGGEIVVVNNGRVQIYSPDPADPKRIYELNLNGSPWNLGSRGGAPNIDDFDGDGFPEIGSAFQRGYVVVDLQPSDAGAGCDVWPNRVPSDLGVAGDDPMYGNPPRTPPMMTCSVDADCGAVDSGYTCSRASNECICEHNSWVRETQDASSRVTGSSVFDFNGDSRVEVVYNDECKFRIFDGFSGTPLFEEDSESRTRIEYPIVADVDNDGNAEIVFGVSNESNFCWSQASGLTPEELAERQAIPYNNGLEVWGDANDAWVSARRIWNQHAYHITNVTEGARIPINEPRHWVVSGNELGGRIYNSARSNPRTLGIAPDLVVDQIQVTSTDGGCGGLGEDVAISARISNIGDLRVGPGVEVGFEGDFGSGYVTLLDDMGQPLLATLTNTLDPLDGVFISIPFSAGDNGETAAPIAVRVTADSTDRETECIENNNSDEISVVASGGDGAELRIELGNAPVCVSVPSFSVRIINDGTIPVDGVVVRFYAGDPAQGAGAIEDVVVPGLVPANGGDLQVNVQLDDFPQCRNITIFAEVDPDNLILECNDANNDASFGTPTFCCDGG